jgi:CxxC-x17-CxxC domain-containing protein
MRDFNRNTGKGRKPSFVLDRQRSKFGRNSNESRGRDRPQGNFRRNDEGENRNTEGRFRRDEDRERRPQAEMHPVVCDKCGKETTVPFKPTGKKPIYCRDCFKQNDDSYGSPRSDNRERSNMPNDELAKINYKLDKIMQALRIR